LATNHNKKNLCRVIKSCSFEINEINFYSLNEFLGVSDNLIQNQMKVRMLLTIMVLFLSDCILNSQKLSKIDVDNFINNIVKQNQLPGLSIAIVFEDSVIYAKGFGIKKIGGSDPVDEHTLYQAASITKSFTATLIGMLVDQGEIKWNDPVKNHIQEFETSEPFVTQRLTIQDLLTLRSGLLGGDTLRSASRVALLPQIKNLQITNSFRLTQSSYNLSYTLLGLIAENKEGKSWEEIVKNKLFMPLSMHETFTDIPAALSSSKNVSIPHYIENGKVIPTKWDECGIYSPADGIFCNVIDLAKFAKFMLNNGKIDNTTIISSEVLKKMHSPQTIVANMFKEYFNPKANLMSLGFGWFVSDYRGITVIQMGGLSSGTTNLLTIIPSKKIGIVIQTNIGGVFDSLVPINYKIFDDLIL
jgi:CubicO group peptidase (beta-lactamase class C family)